MHPEAWAFVASQAAALGPWDGVDVLDIGGRNVNGSVRELFPGARYTALDRVAGPGVDIVADAAAWTPDRRYDTVVCTEVLEHAEDIDGICRTIAAALPLGGRLILTCATVGRPPHGADGGPLRPGEFYRNVIPDELCAVLTIAGLHVRHVEVRAEAPCDLYLVARR